MIEFGAASVFIFFTPASCTSPLLSQTPPRLPPLHSRSAFYIVALSFISLSILTPTQLEIY